MVVLQAVTLAAKTLITKKNKHLINYLSDAMGLNFEVVTYCVGMYLLDPS